MASPWREIMEQIQDLQRIAQREQAPLWYRGQRRAQWPLMSSLHRRIERSLGVALVQMTDSEKIELMRDVYKSLYNKFIARAWHLLDPQERSDWGIIFSMQHHGIPTRLIDWTENFACALFFAQRQRRQDDDAAIFVLDPQKLNVSTIQKEGLVHLGGEESGSARSTVDATSYHPRYVSTQNDAEALAVAPVLTNSRMIAQRAAFLLSGASFEPQEEKYSACIRKVVLPASTYGEVQLFIDTVTPGHFGYFPDLEGLRIELLEGLDREAEAARAFILEKSSTAGHQVPPGNAPPGFSL